MSDITAEMEILNSPSAEVSSESADTSESAAPIEQEQAGEETQFEQPEAQVQAKPQTDRAQQQPGKPQDKTQQAKPTDPAQEAASYAELFPQGIEQAREVHAKAQQMDKEYAALTSGDTSQIAEIIPDIFGGNPGGEASALMVGLLHLEHSSPQHFASLVSMFQSGFLASSGVTWNTLEKIAHALEKAGDRETFEEINKLAAIYRQSGLGPSTPETQAQEWKGYEKSIGALLIDDTESALREAFGSKLSSLQPYMQEQVMQAALADVAERLRKNSNLAAAYDKLARSYNPKAGSEFYYGGFYPQLRAIARVVGNQYNDVFDQAREQSRVQTSPQPARRPAQPARPVVNPPKSMAEADAMGMTLGEKLRAFGGEVMGGSFLPQEEANQMSWEEVLNSSRVALPKKPWSRENELDEVGQ